MIRSRIKLVFHDMGVPDEVWVGDATMTSATLKALAYFSHDPAAMVMLERYVNEASTEVELMKVDRTAAVPGAKPVLDTLHSQGYRVGILTRGSRLYAERALKVTDLGERIDALMCRDDHPLVEAKPAPIALRRTATLLGCEPAECIYIGDHHMDLDCANAAGADFIGVLTGSNDRLRWGTRGEVDVVDDISKLPEHIRLKHERCDKDMGR